MVLIHPKTYHHKVPVKTLELIGMKAKEYIKRTQKTQLPGVSLSNNEQSCNYYRVYLLSKYHTNYKVQLTQANIKDHQESF
jgi:hypothetical protein